MIRQPRVIPPAPARPSNADAGTVVIRAETRERSTPGLEVKIGKPAHKLEDIGPGIVGWRLARKNSSDQLLSTGESK